MEAAHERVARSLTERLQGGEWAVGGRLPAERELAEHYGVHRMTLRQALDGLERLGLVERRPGRAGGTFVAPLPLPLGDLPSLGAALRGLGAASGCRVLSVRERPASADERSTLGDDVVVAIRRLRFTGGTPVALEDTALPAGRFPDLAAEPLAGDLHRLLAERYGAPVVATSERLGATCATEDEAPLAVAPGTPLLTVRREARDAAGGVVELGRDRYAPERLHIRLDRP